MGCTASLPKTVEGPPQIKRKRDSLAVSSSKGNILTPANSVIKETGSANEEARASLEGRTDQIKAAGSPSTFLPHTSCDLVIYTDNKQRALAKPSSHNQAALCAII